MMILENTVTLQCDSVCVVKSQQMPDLACSAQHRNVMTMHATAWHCSQRAPTAGAGLYYEIYLEYLVACRIAQ
jgi:hypothetical protein